MSTDESLEKGNKKRSESVAAEAVDWGSQFLKSLEFEYSNFAAELPAQAAWTEFRRAMIRAFEATLVESGADPDELRSLIQESLSPDKGAEKSVGWTRGLSARRLELIDKMIQRSLSAAEAEELDQLTARLRHYTDTEELIPLQLR